MEYKEWFQQIQFLKDKVILPNNKTIDKTQWVTNKGFDIDRFNGFLFKTYNEIYGR